MSQFVEGRRRTFVAGSGLTAAQFRIVKGSGATVVLASAATDLALGILDNQPVAGDNASVTLRNGQGTAKLILGTGGAAVGSKLTSDANGAGIITTTAGNEVVGIALQTGNAGDVIEVLLAFRTV